MKMGYKVVGCLAVCVALFGLVSPQVCSATVASSDEPQWIGMGPNAGLASAGERMTASSKALADGVQVDVSVPGVLSAALLAPDGNRYVSLSIPGCGVTSENVGEPAMPFKGFFLEIPYGVDVTVATVQESVRSLGKGFNVLPRQPAPPEAGATPRFRKNAAAYARNAWFPATPIVMGEPGFIRGRRVVFVQVFPLQYNPVTTEVRARDSVQLAVSFKGEVDPYGDERKSHLAAPFFESLAETVILNYESVSSLEGQMMSSRSAGDGADYLIIVDDDLVNQIDDLAEWKRRKGYITEVVEMSDVGDDAQDVEDYIQDAYDEWDPAPTYVLLVGDSEDVPPDTYSGSYPCTTDNTYACVDGSDYFPDLVIARITAHTTTECGDVEDKILTYDRYPDDGSWYDSFLSAGMFEDNNDDGIAGGATYGRWFMETSAHLTDFLDNDVGMTRNTAWCTNSGEHDHYYYAANYTYPHRFGEPGAEVPSWVTNLWVSDAQATAAISTAINGGVSIVQHRDHGSVTSWGDPPYSISNINALTNGDKTPVVVSMNCSTGKFDYASGDCFCEAFLEKSTGGCVGIVGSTRTSYSGYNDLLTHGIYTCFWPEYDTDYTDPGGDDDGTYPSSWRPAEALMYGKYYMYTYEGNTDYTEGEFYMFHYFGDPEMMVRTETPEELTVLHPAALLTNAEDTVSVTVTVTDESEDAVEGALVSITHADSALPWAGLTGSDGKATVVVDFTELDSQEIDREADYDIVVTAHNAEPYEGTIDVDSHTAFRVKLGGSNVAWVTPTGDMFVVGDVHENQTTISPGSQDSEFIITDNNGVEVAMVDPDGDLWLTGDVTEGVALGNMTPSVPALIIRDSSEENQLYIDEDGDLVLQGCLSSAGS